MKKDRKKKIKINDNKKRKNINFWLFILAFTIPMICTILLKPKVDNDIWYLLSEGRYIVQNGIYNIDPLSIHEGLSVTVQNWLSASILYITYSSLGFYGIFLLVVLCNYFICKLLFKICNLISDDNVVLSCVITLFTDITLCTYYVVSRPQVFSFIVLLSLIYYLELYIKTNNKKYLYAIPILSIIEINMHASLWWMLWLFTLPYILDSFNIPILGITQGYRKKPLLIAIGIGLLVGFINPYGIKAITFIFTSYGDKYMHAFIGELLPFSLSDTICRNMLVILGIVAIPVVLIRQGNVRFRYLCLFCGTFLLGMMSIKGFSHFIIVSIFPLAYFFKDMFPRTLDGVPEGFKKFLNILCISMGALMLTLFSVLLIMGYRVKDTKNDLNDVMDVLEANFDKESSTIYSSFNNGGYVEFRGFKAYIDPRAELYLKKNNGKEDLFQEFYDLQHKIIDAKEFVKKYNFTHLIVEYDDVLIDQMEDLDYFIIYDNTEYRIRLYVRNDMFTPEEREEIISSYTKALEDAKEKAATE